MAQYWDQILPSEWFNSKFSLILNSEIVPPPYNPNFQDKFFFLKKRLGILLQKEVPDQVVHDMIEYTDPTKSELLVLTEDGTDIFVYVYDDWAWTLTQIFTSPKWNFFQFIAILWGGESVLDFWTATWWTTSTLVDAWQSWTVDQFAWNYVYIQDGAGNGQLRSILSNNATTLTVGWFDFAPASWSVYRIYQSLVNNIIVPAAWWLYTYDWVSFNIIQQTAGEDIEAMTFWKRRFWYVSNGNVSFSNQGDLFQFVDPSTAQNILQTGDGGIHTLYPFWDFIVAGTEEKIYWIRELFDTTWWVYFYDFKELISTQWLFSKDSLLFKKWLFLVASDKVFYSMEIDIVWTDIQAYLEPQGNAITNYLKELQLGVDELNMYSDTDNMYIFNKIGNCQEFVYSNLYRWWMINQYSANVKKRVTINNINYVLWDEYIGSKGWYTDLWNPYWQKIQMIMGQENIFNMKVWKYFDLLFWKSDYIQKWLITFERQISNKRYQLTKDLFDAGYFKSLAVALPSTMWSILFGTSLFGWWNGAIESLSDVDVVKIPLDISWHLVIITIDTWIEEENNWVMFWWIYTEPVSLNAVLQHYKNVI
jgi:hypothetical protein